MLSPRSAVILRYIVGQYITSAVPVASQSIARTARLGVCSATVRNEMALLEQEGYIIRPHTSAGSVPSDKGYRYYVETLDEIQLPNQEKRMISHVFHQVEADIEEWLNLTATLIARLVQNVAIVTSPRAADCRFKHLQLVSLKDSVALAVLVLHGARVRQWLVNFDQPVKQENLLTIGNKISSLYAGMTSPQITNLKAPLTDAEQVVTNHLVKVMDAEDERVETPPYLEGWHFMLNQPEFSQGRQVLSLIEMAEERSLLRNIAHENLAFEKVQVMIGKENPAQEFHNYSFVLSRYGIPGEVGGTVGVIGPTRMPYAQTIGTVRYLASVLSDLLTALYGGEAPGENSKQPGD